MKARRKISAVKTDFVNEIRRLRRFDKENQEKFLAPPSIQKKYRLSRKQIYLLSEALFFSGFRAYETFLQDVFILYCQEKRPSSGTIVKSFIKPQNFFHGAELLKSSMKFLDWTSPDNVITRSETYLKDGIPIKPAISTRIQNLRRYKKIRNHIAHGTRESFKEYKNAIRAHFTTLPRTIPEPGEFLLLPSRSNPNNYLLLDFLDEMEQFAVDIT